MGHPRFNISLVLDTSVHADTITSSIATKLNTYNKFSVDAPPAKTKNELDEIEVKSDIRFNNKKDMDEVISWIKSQIKDNSAVKDWILKARVTRHNCNHADAVQSIQCDKNDFVVEWEYEKK